MNTKNNREVEEKDFPELEKQYVAMWDKGEFEWNHHDGDKLGRKPISVWRIWTTFIKPTIHQELQKAREEERDKILRNILKWSDTATVMETTGKEGAKRATKKLREHLYGSYHFLYQALRIDQSELDQPNK